MYGRWGVLDGYLEPDLDDAHNDHFENGRNDVDSTPPDEFDALPNEQKHKLYKNL